MEIQRSEYEYEEMGWLPVFEGRSMEIFLRGEDEGGATPSALVVLDTLALAALHDTPPSQTTASRGDNSVLAFRSVTREIHHDPVPGLSQIMCTIGIGKEQGERPTIHLVVHDGKPCLFLGIESPWCNLFQPVFACELSVTGIHCKQEGYRRTIRRRLCAARSREHC